MPENKNHAKRKTLNLGQRLADKLAVAAGSWKFISSLIAILIVWIIFNTYLVIFLKWDPYPFILLNLVLSCLAAFQAPVILMSQNRAAERDRARVERDYYINRKAEREIKQLRADILELKHKLLKQTAPKELSALRKEIGEIHEEVEKMEKVVLDED